MEKLKKKEEEAVHKEIAKNWNSIFDNNVIAYDREFWKHCDEKNKSEIVVLKKTDKRSKIAMHCENGHTFKSSPYNYFIRKKTCPYCICSGEKGAINIDETIISFWNDDRFELEQISENSAEWYSFKCPFCNRVFKKRMIDVVKKVPKCYMCMDGQKYGNIEGLDEDAIYLYRCRKREMD